MLSSTSFWLVALLEHENISHTHIVIETKMKDTIQKLNRLHLTIVSIVTDTICYILAQHLICANVAIIDYAWFEPNKNITFNTN